MITEISQFIQTLDTELKNAGIKPKEGLHILLGPENDPETGGIKAVLRQWAVYDLKKEKDLSAADTAFLEQQKAFVQHAWMINTNKCFDAPAKAIHSCSPYCLAAKRAHFPGGEVFKENEKAKKSQVHERLGSYFEKALNLVAEDKRAACAPFAALRIEAIEAILAEIPAYQDLKDPAYVVFYWEASLDDYQAAHGAYLGDKLFNTSEYNQPLFQEIYGTSDFFNGYSSQKPYLKHKTATFEISGRISASHARDLFEFNEVLKRGRLPRPLPMFIYENEQQGVVLQIFKKDALEADSEGRLGYREIIEEVHDKTNQNPGNYYLLNYANTKDGLVFNDFDFVPVFEYKLKGEEPGLGWRLQNLFGELHKLPKSLENVFEFQIHVAGQIFSNALVVHTKKGGYQFKYFDDIDPKYCSDATLILVLRYRLAFYNFIYKSQRNAVTREMFDDILLTGILDHIHRDEFKNNHNSERFNIYQKLNIWFSLSHYFVLQPNNTDSMASKLLALRAFMQELTAKDSTQTIENDDHYAFAAGQVIYYLSRKSESADKTYQRLEPFLQQASARELNKAIAWFFDRYKHKPVTHKFEKAFAEVMAYETQANLRDYMPMMMAGIFSTNVLFSDKEKAELEEATTEEA